MTKKKKKWKTLHSYMLLLYPTFLTLLCLSSLHDECRTCEICGSTAINVSGVSEAEVMEQWNESNDTATATPAAPPVHPAETRNFWQGHRFLNFLLACMVFAFVISWLFHFNVPSWSTIMILRYFIYECFVLEHKLYRRYCLCTPFSIQAW